MVYPGTLIYTVLFEKKGASEREQRLFLYSWLTLLADRRVASSLRERKGSVLHAASVQTRIKLPLVPSCSLMRDTGIQFDNPVPSENECISWNDPGQSRGAHFYRRPSFRAAARAFAVAQTCPPLTAPLSTPNLHSRTNDTMASV